MNLNEAKENCQEELLHTSISVLRYISKLEECVVKQENAISDIYDFQSALEEAKEAYRPSQQPYFIY